MHSDLSIATADATGSQRRIYLTSAVILAAVSTALLPYASVPLAAVPEFNLFYVSFVIVADLATALLLFGQFRASRRTPLLFLAGAYLFTGCIVIPHLVYFSEFATGLGHLSGKPQSAAYLWHFWHIGYPAAVLGYVVAEWRAKNVLIEERRTGLYILLTASTVVGVVLALTALVTVFHDHLPLLHSGRVWNPITYHLGWTMGALTLSAAIALIAVTRVHHVLHLWLLVALVAFFFDFTPNLLAGERFRFGWYMGRIEAIIASGFLLVMLLGELNRLYRDVARATQEVEEINLTLERRVRERTDALERANATLKTHLHEREVLIGEVYHRVNNNLQTVNALMSIERRQFQDPLLHQAFDKISRRVQSMALVHRHLMQSDNLAELDLSLYIQDLVQNLSHGLGLEARNIEVAVEAEPIPASLDTGMRIGLLLNELVSNCAEHAFPDRDEGRIIVSLREVEGSIELAVSDDGVGLKGASPSAGSRIMHALVGQLKGTMDAVSQEGTTYRVHVPLTIREVA